MENERRTASQPSNPMHQAKGVMQVQQAGQGGGQVRISLATCKQAWDLLL